jgi:DNA adenine methylase
MVKKRPFLKWAGNKYRALDSILDSFPVSKRLIEPFVGSAAVFINTDYQSYLLGEENQDLICLYSYLKKEGDKFINYCKQFFIPDNNTETEYYYLRKQFNECKCSRRRAALFLYLNRHGYNGLCRYNNQGIYNVPFGRYIKPYFPYLEMQYFFQKIQKAQLVNGDFSDTFKLAMPGDVIYCDPPYSPIDQESNFTSYVSKKFGSKEQIILSELAMESASKGVTVIISNHDTEFTRHHYRHSEIKSFQVRRNISCKVNSRGNARELLAIFR